MDRPWLALALVMFLAPPMPLSPPIGPPVAQDDAGGPPDAANPAMALPASGFIREETTAFRRWERSASDRMETTGFPGLARRTNRGTNALPGGSAEFSRWSFIENAGQLADGTIRFYTTGPVPAAFTDSGVLFRLQGQGRAAFCTMRLAGANAVRPVGAGALPGVSNFIFGNDPAGWRTGVAAYESLLYPGVYPGTDLRFLFQDGNLKYEFIVEPGASPAGIALEFVGAEPSVEGDALFLDTPAGRFSDSGLWVYQDTAAGRATVSARPVARGRMVAYDIGPYDPSLALVIDPVICSTVLGGAGDDYAIAMTVDRFNNAYVTGETLSADFPVTPYAYSNRTGGDNSTFDMFVTKLAPDGVRTLFSTYIGSSGNDFSHDIRVDDSGAVYVTGYTYGFDFPATPGAFDRSYNGYGDAFVLKLSPSGATLVFSTFVGGDDVDFGYALALGWDGSAYVAGGTFSLDFPTTVGALQPSIRTGTGTQDAFVLRLSANGSALEYCTYLGGGDQDHALGIQVDDEGYSFVTGTTNSEDFPTTAGAFSRDIVGQDAFVAKLDPKGGSLVFSTFLGGSGAETGNALAIGPGGGCYVTGDTGSHDFPADPRSFKGKTDCFAARLDESGARLLFSRLMGGSGDDSPAAIVVDDGGNVTVAGTTDSADLPATPAAENRTLPGRRGLFVARFDPDARHLLYTSYLGGSGEDACAGAALDRSGHLCLAGTAGSADFPVSRKGAPGGTDIFVVRLAPLLVPGPPSIGVVAGHHSVNISWTAPELGGTGLAGYRLYRGLSRSSLDVSWRIPAELSDFEDGGLENGRLYYYALSAVNASGEGALSPVQSAIPGVRPSPPRNLSAAGRPSMVRLSWQPPANAYDLPVQGYRITRWSPGAQPRPLAEVANATSYDDLEAFNDFVYCYSVKAFNIIGESGPSNEASARASERPSPPQNLSAYIDGRAVTLSWDAPDNPGTGSIGDYFVYRQLEDGRLRLVGRTPVRLYVDRDLLAGTHIYRVLANSTVGEGYVTDELVVNITNLPPVASYVPDRLEGSSSTPFLFSSTSYDRDTRIVNYTWDFGDGQRSHKQDPTHYFGRRGLYNITLRVRDADGAEAVTTGMIGIANTPPAIGAPSPGASVTVQLGRSREFSIAPLDPDEDTLVTTWALNGSVAGTGNRLRIGFNRTGSYLLTAVLSDGEASALASWNITVVPAPPPPGSPWRWLLGAALAAAAVVSGLLAYRRRAGRPAALPGRPPRAVRKRAKRPSGAKSRPGKGASQKPIIRKRYS